MLPWGRWLPRLIPNASTRISRQRFASSYLRTIAGSFPKKRGASRGIPPARIGNVGGTIHPRSRCRNSDKANPVGEMSDRRGYGRHRGGEYLDLTGFQFGRLFASPGTIPRPGTRPAPHSRAWAKAR